MLIDFHTHCFPDIIAGKAVAKLAGIGYITPLTDGTLMSNRKLLDECGVDRAVICNIATNTHQTPSVNSFAIEVNRSREDFYPLASVHPDCDEEFTVSELKRTVAAGIKGVKLHPDYMGKYIDDPAYRKIFSFCAENDMFVLIHAGWDYLSPDDIHCTPERILSVMEAFPSLKLVAAHMGSYKLGDDVEKYLVGKRIWFDTSLLPLGGWDGEQAKRILTNHDPDKLLFASDLPWSSPKAELEYLESLGLDNDLLEKIKYKNALALLGEDQ